MNNHVGIIGGGASGVFVLCNLVDLKIEADDLSPLHITLIEKNKALGEGMAYRADYDSNLLNTAAGLLSDMGEDHQFCLKNQPSFLKWVRENEAVWSPYCPKLTMPAITKNAYLPRLLVSIYLRHIMNFYIEIAPKYNININLIMGEAEDMHHHAESEWVVELADKQILFFSHVILALGGFLKNSFPAFADTDLYFNNPWPSKIGLEKIRQCETVAIMGTKLSALDTFSILKSHDYQGKIVMASRSGFLPSVKNEHHHYKPFLLTTDTLPHLINPVTGKIKLNDLLNLVKSEMEYACDSKINWNRVMSEHHFSMSWLFWQIKMAKNPNSMWNSVLAAASDFFIAAWNLLDQDDKFFFKKHIAPIWDTYRFSMPLCTATDIVDAIKNKKLSILSKVSRVKQRNKQFHYNGFDVYQKKWISMQTDCLVNATGINYDTHKIQSPFLKNVLNRGIIQANFDDGICVDFDSLSILNQKNIYVLGDLTKGTYLYTNSYLLCKDQAVLIAKSVLCDVSVGVSAISRARLELYL